MFSMSDLALKNAKANGYSHTDVQLEWNDHQVRIEKKANARNGIKRFQNALNYNLLQGQASE